MLRGLQEPGAASKWTEGSPAQRELGAAAPSVKIRKSRFAERTPPRCPPLRFARCRRAAPSYQGRIISSVEFQGVSLTNEAGAHLHQLALKPGEPLNRSKLADSVRALYATGRFADLAVEAEAHGSDEVDLVYRATPNYFVGVVTATGAPGLPATRSLQMPPGCGWASFIPAAPWIGACN